MTVRAVAYLRVSSAGQRDRHTIESQARTLPEYIARMGWQLVKPIGTYVDDGHTAKSGHLEARRGLSALLRDAGAGLFDIVAVVDVDRLTRAEDLAERGMILGALQVAGVKVASAMGGEVMDLNSDMGDLMASLRASFAAADNRKRSARVLEGKITAAKRGGKSGGLDPYGLQYSKAAGWSMHLEEAAIVREIFARVIAGDSCLTIADDFNRRGIKRRGRKGPWARGRVWDIVKSRHVVGEYIAHAGTRTVVAVPAIVDEDTWQRAGDALTAAAKAPLRKTKHVYLLEGLARCGACGGRIMVLAGWLARGRFRTPARYVCEHRKYRKVGPDRCAAPFLQVADVDARAWALICREVLDPELAAELAADRQVRAADQGDHERDAAGYRAHLARLDKVATAHRDRYRRGVLTDADFDSEMAAINRERAMVQRQLAFAERARGSTLSAQARLGAATAQLEGLRAKLATASPEERREIARALIDPGGVVFRGAALHVELFVERPVSSDSDSAGLAAGSVWSGGSETYLRIRAVA